MINNELRDIINSDADLQGAIILDNPSFDNSIVGKSLDGRLIYSYDKMVEEMVKDDAVEYVDAMEFIDYNTFRALPYMGEKAPIILLGIDYAND